jgi:hypothetical protein
MSPLLSYPICRQLVHTIGLAKVSVLLVGSGLGLLRWQQYLSMYFRGVLRLKVMSNGDIHQIS